MKKLLLTAALLIALTAPVFAEPTPAESTLWQDCDAAEYVAKVDALARLLYGEAQECNVEGQAAIVWCVLNRVDDPRFPDTALEVVTQPGQFFGYREDYPVLPELVEVVEDVLMRYAVEQSGIDAGRVLPREYVYFSGDGVRNNFTREYADGDIWGWTLRSPYRED